MKCLKATLCIGNKPTCYIPLYKIRAIEVFSCSPPPNIYIRVEGRSIPYCINESEDQIKSGELIEDMFPTKRSV